MFELVKRYKREFVYTSYLFLIFELLSTPSFVVDIRYFVLTALVGYILINIWLINTYKMNVGKKISKYSDAFMKVKMWDRLFTYVLLPLVFYSSVSVFLLLSSQTILNQIVIVISSFLFFFLFLYVRTSYQRVYSLSKATRVAYDFVTIAVFFLVSSVIIRSGIDNIYSTIIISLFSFIAFIYTLHHHGKLDLQSTSIAIASSVSIGLAKYFMAVFNFNVQSAVLSVIFYLVISLWNVRFGGARKFSDYLPPLMYALMACILIMSL